MCGLCPDGTQTCAFDHHHGGGKNKDESASAPSSSGSQSGSGTGGGALVDGTAHFGTIGTVGAQDVYSVNLVAGQTYAFAMHAVGATSIGDSYLTLRGPNNAVVAENDDMNNVTTNAMITFQATTTGTYALEAKGFGNNTGDYMVSMANGNRIYAPTFTVDQIADYLQHTHWQAEGGRGVNWAPQSIITYSVSGLTAGRQALAADSAFEAWSQISGLTFRKVSGSAQITFDDNSGGAFASWSSNGRYITSATINVARNWDGGSTALDSYAYQTILHEIGHALGLGHSGSYDGNARHGIDNTYANDYWGTTVMSYFDQRDAGLGSYRDVATPMIGDVRAIQNMYGIHNVCTDHTTYGFNSTVAQVAGQVDAGDVYNFANYARAPSLTIVDSGGVDTLDASGYAQDQKIDLTPGARSDIGGLTGNIVIYDRSTIENAIGGSGDDTLIGNAAANRLVGNGGRDTLNGGGGNDRLEGGT
ncbi:MAG: M10 family metallopeptidase C-terminal domain-containing protein, partial [Pseudomonadota bacterium]